jgi:hypothetical protein
MFNRLNHPELIAKGLPQIKRQEPATVCLQPVMTVVEQPSPATETQTPARNHGGCNLGFIVLRFTA